MNGLMSSVWMIVRGIGAVAGAAAKQAAQTVLAAGGSGSPGQDRDVSAVTEVQRQVADLRQRVLHLEAQIEEAARSGSPSPDLPTSARGGPRTTQRSAGAAKKSAQAAKKATGAAKKATGTTKKSAAAHTTRRSRKQVPPPDEVSGIPDTPATVAERATVTKPAE